MFLKRKYIFEKIAAYVHRRIEFAAHYVQNIDSVIDIDLISRVIYSPGRLLYFIGKNKQLV